MEVDTIIQAISQEPEYRRIKEIGFDLVITNAYITKNHYGDKAISKGIHKIIDFDKSIMTDSGGYQVLEYGDVDVLPPDMANFEKSILTDFAIPLDKPTGYGLPRKKAQSYVNHTLKVSKTTLQNAENNGPPAGGDHADRTWISRSCRTGDQTGSLRLPHQTV